MMQPTSGMLRGPAAQSISSLVNGHSLDGKENIADEHRGLKMEGTKKKIKVTEKENVTPFERLEALDIEIPQTFEWIGSSNDLGDEEEQTPMEIGMNEEEDEEEDYLDSSLVFDDEEQSLSSTNLNGSAFIEGHNTSQASSTMDDDMAWEWLEAHNSRRLELHSRFGLLYVPLKWSLEVADSAETYAELLLDAFNGSCNIAHGLDNSTYGENLAMNAATTYEYSQARSPDQVLRAWFEEEELLEEWSHKFHYMQVGWRNTQYVGCGQASKILMTEESGPLFCNIQVCRYVRPGNCNIGPDNWQYQMLSNASWDSPCEPFCPLHDGCF